MTTAILNPFPKVQNRTIGFAIALIGALLMSIDPLFIRFAGVSGFDTAFLFGFFTAIAMPVVLHFSDKRGIKQAIKQSGWPLLAAAMLMLGSSTGLVFSIKNTSIANTFVILAATPALAAIFSWVFLKERTSRTTWIAIVAVIVGIVIVAYGSIPHGADTEASSMNKASHWVGDLLALIAAVFLALMFTLLRKYQQVSRLAAVGLGALFLAVVMFFFASPSEYSSNTWMIMAAMGLLTAPMGRVMSMSATRYITAAEVSMTLMLETVLATVWGVIFFNEVPQIASIIGGSIILITIAIYTGSAMKEKA